MEPEEWLRRARLADAADHLLDAHACDGHGHEEIAAARDAARKMLAEWS